MWDSQRLSAWGVLRKAYGYNDSVSREVARRAELDRRYEEALRTEELRSKIWQNGGRGYWTEDESKIVWHTSHLNRNESGLGQLLSNCFRCYKVTPIDSGTFFPCYKVASVDPYFLLLFIASRFYYGRS